MPGETRFRLATRTGARVVMWAVLFAMAPLAFGDAVNSSWPNRFEPAEGITAAGQPTASNLEELAAQGYAAVIDLRTAGENRGLDERQVVESLGLDYISLEIAGKGAINFANARELDRILKRYDRPVLIHCGSGNRVGALLALREKIHGADDQAAVAFGKTAGLTTLEETVRNVMAGE